MSEGSPAGVALRGALAGAAGTAAMTAAQTVYMKATGGEPSDAPARVGKRIIEGVLGRKVPRRRMGLLNNVMHWLYGTSWGVLYTAVSEVRSADAAPSSGLAFGTLVWGASLVQLPALGLAPPVWEQDPQTIAPDLGFHLVYGAAVGGAARALGT